MELNYEHEETIFEKGNVKVGEVRANIEADEVDVIFIKRELLLIVPCYQNDIIMILGQRKLANILAKKVVCCLKHCN